jgi:hypothetical protein
MGKKPVQKDEAGEDFELFEENIEAVSIFGRLTTQWNTNFRGDRVGLNYSSLKLVMDLAEVADQKTCFKKVRIMEKAALERMER